VECVSKGAGLAGLIAFAAPFDTISASLQSLRMQPLSSYLPVLAQSSENRTTAAKARLAS
jgi:hypothetical protein